MTRLPILLALVAAPATAAWTIQLEEPTGIYRRENEVVRAVLRFKDGEARDESFRVFDGQGRAVPVQVAVLERHPSGSIAEAEVLFPASLLPGELPRYRVEAGVAASHTSDIVVRRLGESRLEMANRCFGVIVNLGAGGTELAIVEAYSRTAGPDRMLNLVETTPDVKEAPPFGVRSAGWGTAVEGSGSLGGFTKVEILESGPLRARVRLAGAKQRWEFEWTSSSAVLKWKATRESGPGRYGFFFSSVSTLPYEPFNRFVHGGEDDWPQGPESTEPPDHDIGPRPYGKLPGGHGVYYRQEENYGALGILAVDPQLEWHGIGARQFYATKAGATAEIAISFPRWNSGNTVLEARKEYRMYRQPILATVVEKPEVRSPQQAGGFLESFSLDGDWRLAWTEKGEGETRGLSAGPEPPDLEWRTVRVPGTVHTQILQAPLYYSPEADWISGKEWWYRRSFRPPPGMASGRLRLQFEATDYYADVWLNGRYLGRHEGYIDPYEFELAPGELNLSTDNLLAVRVWTPVTFYWRHRPYYVKGSYGAVDQKPDNITALGITRPVRLVSGGPVVLRDLAVDTRLLDGDAAEVDVRFQLDGPAGATVDFELAPANFSGGEALRLTSLGPQAVFHVKQPQLWWTWDHGRPNLYRLTATVRYRGQVSDRRSLRVGIREIDKVGWTFYLNRRRMFIRGTNYYYNLFLSEMDRTAYERDVALMKGMNVNMIRLHCHFTNPEFYDLADENGILIWQDYLEAWYPQDRDFAVRAAALYDPLIRYARNHPSVALWATSDEEDLENYRTLTKHLAPRLYALDPQRRPVVRSTGRYGDGHIYYGWYRGSIWQYATMEEAFVSELGATAIPNYESLVKFLPRAWPIQDHADEWVFHKLQIPEAMRAWGDPGGRSLQEYIPITQNYVARLFQIALERMRRRKYQAGGILHFHAIDIWPSVTMAAVDFYRVPTKVYETVRRSFEPVAASFEYDRDNWKAGDMVRVGLWVVNDRWEGVPGARVEWKVGDQEGRHRLDIPADSSQKLGEIVWKPAAAGNYEMRARVIGGDGRLISENVFEFAVR